MTNRINGILNNFPTFWKRQSNSNNYKIARSVGTELNLIETQKLNLVLDIQIETSSGSALDDLGRFFRLARMSGESDETFRSRIKGFWQLSAGSSTVEGIKRAIASITNEDIDNILIAEVSLKIYYIVIPADLTNTALREFIQETVDGAKAAGVYAKVVFIHNYTTDVIPAGVHSAGDAYVA